MRLVAVGCPPKFYLLVAQLLCECVCVFVFVNLSINWLVDRHLRQSDSVAMAMAEARGFALHLPVCQLPPETPTDPICVILHLDSSTVLLERFALHQWLPI